MNREQRIAMARIISDMIKADNIIEESEIKKMKELMNIYGINQEHMGDSRNKRFSDAVNLLHDLSERNRKDFLDHIYEIAVCDNICVPREALLHMALKFCLLPDNENFENQPYLISCPTGEPTINDLYMVYLESSHDEVLNTELKNHFRLLVTVCRLCGFNFIYIPKLVEEFGDMDQKYVMEVIKYMAPNLEKEIINDVYDKLCHMSTSEFCLEVLKKRLHVNMPHNINPTLLINIGTSVVPYCSLDGKIEYYTEFLCIPIQSSIMTLVDKVLEYYQSKVSIYQTISLKSNKGHFKYFGFYKALFDFLIATPPVAPDLIFLDNLNNHYEVAFKYSEKRIYRMRLTPQEYEAYYNIARQTYHNNGNGWHEDNVNKTVISHIRTSIKNTLPNQTYTEQYMPYHAGRFYVLYLDRSKVFEKKYIDGKYKEVPL